MTFDVIFSAKGFCQVMVTPRPEANQNKCLLEGI